MVEPDRKTDPADQSPGEMALGCIVILLVLWGLGSCVFGGSEEPKPVPADTPPVAAPVQAAAKGDGVRVGSTMLEQAIFDAFPAKPPKGERAKRNASNAANFIGATINSAGYLCAHPFEVQQVAAGQYGIGCRKYRNGGGRSNFIVDVRTGSVSEL